MRTFDLTPPDRSEPARRRRPWRGAARPEPARPAGPRLAPAHSAALLDALTDGVLVVDRSRRIIYANQAAASLTGYAQQELCAARWDDLRPAAAQPQIDAALRSGTTWSGPLRCARRDGGSLSAQLTVVPAPNRGGPALYILRAQPPAPGAAADEGPLVADVSHELRNPLAIIALHSGNLEMLYDRLDDGHRRRLIAAIRHQAGLLDALLGDLLDLARARAGWAGGRQGPVDLGRLLRDEAEQQAPLAAHRGVSLTVEVERCPPARADERAVRQVIRNLLGNALKYTGAGGAVHCRCAGLAGPADPCEWPGAQELGAGAWPALQVRDSGIGIAAQDLPRLFERFYRAGGAGAPGTGLGLAIAHELVQRAGGRLGVASTPGRGSTFAVYLPPACP